MQGQLLGQVSKGGLDINGIIEEYKIYAGENISAGDFVSYIQNEIINTGNSISTNDYVGYTISAVALDENTVFIAHNYSTSYYLYGIVISINNGNFTIGTDTKMNANSYGGMFISAVKVSNNKVFIAHSLYNAYYLYGIVCTINETTITVGTDTVINQSNRYMANTISAVKVSDNKVFIAHSYGESSSNQYKHTYGIVCNISGTTITKGTDTNLGTSRTGGRVVLAALFAQNKVFVFYDNSSWNNYNGLICSIEQNTITPGTIVSIASGSSAERNINSMILLKDNKLFIAYAGASTNLYGIIIEIVDDTIIKGTTTLICSEGSSTGKSCNVIRLKSTEVCIIHSKAGSSSNTYLLYTITCKINDKKIIPKDDIQLSANIHTGDVLSAVLLNNIIFIAHSYYSSQFYNLYYTLLELEKQLKTITSSTDEILGIANQNGIGEDTIEVYIPETN